ncbi:MAG TPA: peptidoglycan DD-metalloendopeptidase family protein [Polyangiaceae bacterium LLY-WYZ-15_(1-7)]|nr:hypothetical protein [Myxococcales bacterium]MAT29332.1 hypothetical protein [Sandaracinus sp.]HJK92406.1 peptidoglycan DD-metalloendopeptidase family protein [Polyangiaceae bacterium LLY-WYZ-15_(1-7)]MBJ72131.1 hypothetical protein [Sandaracinus sp.]HJL05415.1 peptidoglycan DD-metalloendopeptidase family protein [Polyangiaceae bacterium LLY-WYZ-15_(1-7)]
MRIALRLALILGLAAPVLAQPPLPLPGAPAGASAESTRLAAELEQAEARASRSEATQARLEAEVEALAGRRDEARSQLRSHARALYRMRRAGMLPVAGGFDAMLSHLSRLERLERMVRSDVAAVRFLGQRGQALREELGRAAAEGEEARQRAAALRARKAQVDEQARLQQAYAGLFDPSGRPRLPMPGQAAAPMGHGTIRVHGAPQASRGFAAQRGQLAMPVAASGEIREASRQDGAGLELRARSGASVVAVAEGTVVHAQAYPGYGQLVIVDHGEGYYTLYAGLGQATAVNGQWLPRGARLGVVGSEPLYFEVRQGTRSLGARSWIGL